MQHKTYKTVDDIEVEFFFLHRDSENWRVRLAEDFKDLINKLDKRACKAELNDSKQKNCVNLFFRRRGGF